ncbi:MAG: mandelate racemase/muconate lactonizing enzyme family protein [Candidatus Latescibacteria bacterium]|jgi:galactonate dehydratase|nr:mandelate racemase/muconate lactonizing enzyme family protein [Candidatus Latescibacterota bacterium]MDP7448210.1 mandelate racemase/muconate lactonizing enzyme family protein [Candidatus Latescibacterota bacterium]HJP33543.1 mandelate racemase/muconate lactonizing enzyme family protein [Candidatus Latescibacterota bacterium]
MINTDFTIARIDTFHLALSDQPSYWEDYKGKGGDAAGARFEFRDGWRTVYPLTVETYLIRVELTDGSIGWGEGNCPIGPEVACLVAESVQQPMVLGREFEGAVQLWDFLYDAQRGRGYASGYWLDSMAAIDIAVYDALGRREGVPVAAMLCEKPRTQLPVYLSGLRRRTREERLEDLKRWLDTGLTGVKLFVDGDLDSGSAEVEFLQAGVGDGVDQWMVDTLWMVSPEHGPEARRRYGEMGCRWLECPLEPEDLAGHRELLTHPGAPIALGEHFRTHFQTEPWFETPRALDVFQPDIGRTGFSDGLRQLAQARASGVPTTPHMGNGLGPFQAATLHFAAACGDELLQEYQAGLAARATLVGSTAWTYDDGIFRVPQTPGLGVEVDEQALARYVVR